jgi:hypothetical protein
MAMRLCLERTRLPGTMTKWSADRMADTKPALVLHLASGGEPLVFALPDENPDELAKKLPLLVQHGSVEAVQNKEGSSVVVNFAHVAAAYVEDLQRRGKVFGLH